MRKKIKIVSLFSGCGGLDLGFTGGFSFLGHDFERLNTEIAFANDFDADAQICYNSNPLLTNDGAQCLLEDIRNVDATLLSTKKSISFFEIVVKSGISRDYKVKRI